MPNSHVESGQPVVEGIAIGGAIVWAPDPPPRKYLGTIEEERARLSRAIARASRGVKELARRLPPAEAELFEPEVAILTELGTAMLARVERGERPEEVVNSVTSQLATDLLDDARARLLDGLAHDERSVQAALEGREGDRLLVTETLTPSVVASLPAHVVGIVAAGDISVPQAQATSHAAILARARDIPLATLPPHVVRSIHDDDVLVLDTTATPASLWVTPPGDIVAAATAWRDAWAHRRAEEEAAVAAPLTHLGVNIHINVGSLDERIPASVEGIGLVRTELLFSDHTSAPSESEQFGAIRALAARVGDVPLTVRLFDAGGDKRLEWLDGRERGIELLMACPGILDTQLRALSRAGQHARVRVLLPLVARAEQVEHVRTLSRGVPLGAMIETPEAVDRVEEIASACDFLSIGTNDLSAALTGQRRANSTLSLDPRILMMVSRIVDAAHARGLEVSVCGEMAGDPQGARLLVGLGVDTLSIAPGRLANVKLSLRDVTIDDCRRVLRETLPQSEGQKGFT